MSVSKKEFAEVMAFLALGVSRETTGEQIRVYYELLNDLPFEALKFAAKHALLENQYQTIPPAGVLRKLAVESIAGKRLTSGEAYEKAREAIRKFGYVAREEGLASLPKDVAAVVRQIGWDVWCDSTNPDAIRARFVEFWNAVDTRRRRTDLLPEGMRERLTASEPTLAHAIKQIAKPVE